MPVPAFPRTVMRWRWLDSVAAMNPQEQLMQLLREHNFDLVRQRKHKIYRNPNGLTFVTASTPSDRRAPQNALSTLKRILRDTNACDDSAAAIDPVSVVEPAPVTKPVSTTEALPMIDPPASMSDREWEAWKRQYWLDEKLRAKNERFLTAVSTYVGRVSELMHARNDVASIPGSDAVKSILRELHYKSKVVFYNFKGFDQGIVVHESSHQPILWASNGHIGISAFLFFNAYVQHGPLRPATIRFDWDGIPVLFELPEKDQRKFHLPSSRTRKTNARHPRRP